MRLVVALLELGGATGGIGYCPGGGYCAGWYWPGW